MEIATTKRTKKHERTTVLNNFYKYKNKTPIYTVSPNYINNITNKVKTEKIDASEAYPIIWDMVVNQLSKENKKFDREDQYLIKYYKLLTAYFSNNEWFNSQYTESKNGKKQYYSLNKSLLVIGVPGRGKTFALEIFQQFLKNYNTQNYFHILRLQRMLKSAIEENKLDFLNKYNNENIVLDDLFIDENNVFYNKVFLSEHLFEQRFELFRINNIKTHITTNSNSADLKKKLKPRNFSRLFQMFNIIQISGDNDYRVDFI